MDTMKEGLDQLQKEIDRYGQAKVLFGKWTLKELAKKIAIFNKSKRKNSLACRKIIGDFLSAHHIRKIKIIGVGTYESRVQAERNGPMIGGRRDHRIELDLEKNQLNILVRKDEEICPFARWPIEKIIPFERIKKIKMVRVPAGLRHLEIELHTPCPD